MSLARRLLYAVSAYGAVWVLLLSAPASALMPGPLAELRVQLGIASQHAPGQIGIDILDLASGMSAGINERVSMPAASTIKVPVMVEVFRQMEAGKIGLRDEVHVQASDKDYGSGDISDAPSGRGYTVNQLLHVMIDESDNTAANMLIRLVGRMSVNSTMRALGMTQTELASDIRTDRASVRYALRTSPRDMVHLFMKMAQQRLIDAWSSRQMYAILANQHINTLLPVPLPRDVTIAHKTGSLHDTLNDVGIVDQQGEPYVIAVLTTELSSLGAGRIFIRHVSLMAYDSFQQLAVWRQDRGLPAFAMNTPADALEGSVKHADQMLSPAADGLSPDNAAPLNPTDPSSIDAHPAQPATDASGDDLHDPVVTPPPTSAAPAQGPPESNGPSNDG